MGGHGGGSAGGSGSVAGAGGSAGAGASGGAPTGGQGGAAGAGASGTGGAASGGSSGTGGLGTGGAASGGTAGTGGVGTGGVASGGTGGLGTGGAASGGTGGTGGSAGTGGTGGTLPGKCSPIVTQPNTALSSDTYPRFDMHLAWTGSQYAAVWKKQQSLVYQYHFALLNDKGARIGAEVKVTNASYEPSDVSLAHRGSEFGLSWRHPGWMDGGMMFQRLSSVGLAIGAPARPVQPRPLGSNQYSQILEPRMVANSSGYAAVWTDVSPAGRQLYFGRIGADGLLIGSVVPITTAAVLPEDTHLIWTGQDYALVWVDQRDVNREIYFTRLSVTGTKLIPEVNVTKDPTISMAPQVASSSAGLGVTWTDDQFVYFTLLKQDGSVQVARTIASDGVYFATDPQLLSTGSEFGLFMRSHSFSKGQLYFKLITAAGVPSTPYTMTNAADEPLTPAGVFAGTGFGLVWSDRRDGQRNPFYEAVGCKF